MRNATEKTAFWTNEKYHRGGPLPIDKFGTEKDRCAIRRKSLQLNASERIRTSNPGSEVGLGILAIRS